MAERIIWSHHVSVTASSGLNSERGQQQPNSPFCLDLLLIVLEDEAEEEEFGRILELLIQEFENILCHGEFQLAVKILDHLKKLHNGALKKGSGEIR